VRPGIQINIFVIDGDVRELRIRVSDRASLFTNYVYVGQSTLVDAIASLVAFQKCVHHGSVDIQFGSFGPSYAGGAFCARFHTTAHGRLFVACEQESQLAPFGIATVASHATMYIMSELALLDRFIDELRAVAAGIRDDAFLEAV